MATFATVTSQIRVKSSRNAHTPSLWSVADYHGPDGVRAWGPPTRGAPGQKHICLDNVFVGGPKQLLLPLGPTYYTCISHNNKNKVL